MITITDANDITSNILNINDISDYSLNDEFSTYTFITQI